jgi:3-oxoacyl-[acyl-carrier protein] reductase
MNTKWVLITGGSRGLGRAMVEKLSQEHPVIFTWNTQRDAAEEVLKACENNPFSVTGYQCDGGNAEAVSTLGETLLARYGAPYGIVHNAGITADALHYNYSNEQWLHIMNSNLNAVFHWHKVLLPAMILSKLGSIILMSSVTGIKGNIGQTAYGATKAAMIGLSRSLALENARFNIRVNCLLPGVIESDMFNKLSDEHKKEFRKKIPLRRPGYASEIAEAAIFLLGAQSSYMTGQALVIDGGLTA